MLFEALGQCQRHVLGICNFYAAYFIYTAQVKSMIFCSVEQWRKRNKISFVPIPAYIAHGLHNFDGEALRFLVMPRFGTDLHQLWLKANKRFKRETVSKIAIIMVSVTIPYFRIFFA